MSISFLVSTCSCKDPNMSNEIEWFSSGISHLIPPYRTQPSSVSSLTSNISHESRLSPQLTNWSSSPPIFDAIDLYNGILTPQQVAYVSSYPLQPSSVSSLTSNISHGSSLSPQLTNRFSGPPIFYVVRLYNNIPAPPPQHVDYASYPLQPSSLSSLTSNISHGLSLSQQSTDSSSSPPIIDAVRLYSVIPHQQVDYASIYPLQPSSLSSLTSNISNGSNLSSESTIPPTRPPIIDAVGLYSVIPHQQVDYASIYPLQPSSVSSLTSNISHDSSLPPESTISSTSPPITDAVGLYNDIIAPPQQVDNASSELPRMTYQRCNCKNCKNEKAGLPPVVGPDQNGRKLHLCHYTGCAKTYLKTTYLKGHLYWHNGERPFTCTWIDCGKGFTRFDKLQRHERNHSEERPFSCSICEKKFKRKYHLSQHSKIHIRKTNESSKINTESRPVEEHRQIDTIIDDDIYIENVPQSISSHELSTLTN